MREEHISGLYSDPSLKSDMELFRKQFMALSCL